MTARMPRTKSKTRLQHIREKRKLSLDDVARLVGGDIPQVSRWERHIREPSRESRRLYAKALGVTIGELGRIVYDGSLDRKRGLA